MDLYNIESDDNEKNNIQITSEFSEQIPTPNDLDADVPAPERSRDNDKSLTPSEIKKIQTKINKNILLISFAFLLNFTSFGGLSKLQSSLHHAQGMGVITQSILYGVFVVSCLFIPKIVIVKIGHKWTIAVSFVGYILWMAANGYAVWATMLPASVLVGLCAAPLWTAQSSYFTLMAGKYSSVTQISQDDIVTRFFGIFFMFFQTHNIIGNIISSVVLGQKGPNATEPTEQDLAKCGADDCPWVRTNNTNLIKPSPDSPQAVMFSCIDSRVMMSPVVGSEPGDVFLVRNAGNLVPHADCLGFHSASNEPAALELGCVSLGIKDVIVNGHSNCKAMQGLNQVGEVPHAAGDSPMQLWLKRHGASTIKRFRKLEASGFKEPLKLNGETPRHNYEAFIDPENKLESADKLSQVSCLLQLDNISSYPFLKDQLETGKVHLHATWFDVFTGDVYLFCRTNKQFTLVNDDTCDHLLHNIENWYNERSS